MTFATGTVLDNYTVEGILGQGGMAMVYKVRHVDGSLHALKVLSAPSHAIKERLIREGQIQGALRHPNLVPVTDLIEISGSPGLVMEFVDGPSLEALLERYRPTLQQSDSLAIGILEGVAHAHRRGFIHRDLKPANVLLANTPRGLVPKVTDFGLAKLVSNDEPEGLHHTRSGIIMGTPAYMSPEQIRDSKHVDPRADVFSLGVMLYELVTGRKPFFGKDIVEIYTAITNGRYRPIGELLPTIPARMERAISSALIVDRNARISDCDKMLAIWRGDETSRRSFVTPESGSQTVVPHMPDVFVPRTTGNPEKEITFHDAPTEVLPSSGGTRDHPMLQNLGALTFAVPDFGEIDPASDIPAQQRNSVPVGLSSIDLSQQGPDREETFTRGPPSAVIASIVLAFVVVAGLGIAVAVGAYSLPAGLFATTDAAPVPTPAPVETPPAVAPGTLPAAPLAVTPSAVASGATTPAVAVPVAAVAVPVSTPPAAAAEVPAHTPDPNQHHIPDPEEDDPPEVEDVRIGPAVPVIEPIDVEDPKKPVIVVPVESSSDKTSPRPTIVVVPDPGSAGEAVGPLDTPTDNR